MERTTKMKLTLPKALKSRVEKIAEKLSIPTASAMRLALTEFCEKNEQK